MRRFLALTAIVISLVSYPLFADTPAVLPFFNLSNNANLNWVGECLAVMLAESLRDEGLMVPSREDRLEVYRRMSLREDAVLTRASIIRVAEALDADYVIYGRYKVSPSGQTDARAAVEITGRIIDIKQLRQSPEFRQTGALAELAALLANLSWDMLKFISPDASRDETGFKTRWRSVRLDAIENYVRGLMAAGFQQKHRFFTQAARLDERFSQPRFQLGRLHMAQKNYGVASDWFQRVGPEASNAREARFLYGVCRYYAADFAGARAAFESVAAAVPLNEVFNNLGAARARLGDPGAVENFRRAFDGDSSDLVYNFNLGWALWKAGDFQGCAPCFEAVLERRPDDTEAASMLDRCRKQVKPRAVETPGEPLPRLKLNYEERAWRQLREMLQPQPPKSAP